MAPDIHLDPERLRAHAARAELLHRDVDRQAEDSGGLARRIADGISTAVADGIGTTFADANGPALADANPPGSGPDLAPGNLAADAPTAGTGPRLAGTDGERVPPGWGMRIGVLPEPPR